MMTVWGEGAVAGLNLGEVLPDGDKLDATPRAVEAIWARSGRGAMLAASSMTSNRGFVSRSVERLARS